MKLEIISKIVFILRALLAKIQHLLLVFTIKPKRFPMIFPSNRVSVVFFHFLMILFLTTNTANASKFTLNGLASLMSSNNISEEIYFTENKSLRFLNKPLILTGRFYFRSSNFLQKNIDTPFVKVYTLKRNTITYTNKKLESKILTLTDHPLIYSSMKAFYTTMSGDFGHLINSYNMVLSGTSNKWQLILTPRSKRVLKYISNIQLNGNHTFIERVITNESNGNSSTIWMRQ